MTTLLHVGRGVVISDYSSKVDSATIFVLDTVEDKEECSNKDEKNTNTDTHTNNNLQWQQLK